MKLIVFIFCFCFLQFNVVSQQISLKEKYNSINNIMQDVKFLSSDELEGRATGTIGEKKAAEYIHNKMSDLGLKVFLQEFDVVFHVAAVPRVSYSVENPADTTLNNVAKTVKLMEACRGKIDRFVFSSSSSVYGGADLMPTPADYPRDPKSPYAWHKSSIEDLLRMFGNLYDFDSVCLRYFNVFGPNQYGDSPYSTAISAWCHAIKHGTPLRKDGTGEQSRDMCYVDNVVDVNIRAANYEGTLRGEAFNVACGDRTSNNQILAKFEEKFGDLDVNQAPFRAGDVMHTQADISETERVFGYKPLVRFWDGLEKTFEWWDI